MRDENEAPIPYHDLLGRARRGDPAAFERLYDATHRRLFSYLVARAGDQSAAEDLLQDVYLAALSSMPRFRGESEGEFVGWLLKIAHGKVVDRLRAQYRHPEVNTARVFPTERCDPNERIDEQLGRAEIAGALAQLTDEQREVVMSRLVLGFTLEETSRRMRKNVGAIKALQHRALARLAKSLLAGDADNA